MMKTIMLVTKYSNFNKIKLLKSIHIIFNKNNKKEY